MLQETPRLPGYDIEGELGQGGMGVVYKARQVALQRWVAVKMILDEARTTPEEPARFQREAEAIAQLQHPNIVQIHEVGEFEGRPYLVLEFVEGGNLSQQLAGTPQPPRVAAELVETLARTLHFAHGRGIVHRDLKPANVLLTADKIPKITDFGLAKRLGHDGDQTRTGVIMGTPSYMAPEQARGRRNEIGPRTDVYSLGTLLYESLTGRPPFSAPTALETVHQVLFDDAVPPKRLQPKLPHDLETICLKCLEKEPNRRYPSAQALADDLRRFLAGEPILARPISLWHRGAKWARRRPALASLLGVSGVALAALVLVMWLHNAQLKRERDDSRKARELAQANATRARQAVDRFYTKVTETKLLNVPRLEPLKKDLLQTAGHFYEEMIHEQPDDPAVRVDLGRAYWRLGTITSQTESKKKAIELLEKARTIQERLAAESPDSPENLNNLAATCNTLGGVHQMLGETETAGGFLKRAVQTRERLATDYPDVPEYQNNLAASRHNLGQWYRRTGAMADAESACHEAISIRQRLMREHPKDLVYQSDLAQSYNGLADVYRATGRPEKAEAAWKETAKLEADLSRRQPHVAEYQHYLSWAYINLGGVCYLTQRPGDAATAWLKARKCCENLVRDYPDVPEYQSDLAAVTKNLASLYYMLGQYPQSEAAYQKALEIQDRLCHDHPEVVEYQNDLASIHNNLSALYHVMRTPEKAEQAFAKALAVREKLVRENPEMIEFAVGLGSVLCNKAQLVRESGQNAEALDWYGRALRTLATVLKKVPRHPDARQILRETYGGRALAMTQLRRAKEAIEDWDKAIEFDAGPGLEDLRMGRLSSVIHLGDHAGTTAEAMKLARDTQSAQTVYSAAEIHSLASVVVLKDSKLVPSARDQLAGQYAARAVEFLGKARKVGYFSTAEKVNALSKEPDLAAIRGRDDFKKFVTELQEMMKSKR